MKKILLLIAALFAFTLISNAKVPIDENANNYTEVKAAHILVGSESKAKALRNRIENGESFSEVAKKYSACPSGEYGGNLGYFGRGKMVKEFEDAAFFFFFGVVSDPVQTDFGWHLIKVYDKK